MFPVAYPPNNGFGAAVVVDIAYPPNSGFGAVEVAKGLGPVVPIVNGFFGAGPGGALPNSDPVGVV